MNPYFLSEEDLEALTVPAIEELRERLGGSYAASLAGIAGLTVPETYLSSCMENPTDAALRTCALMIEPGLMNDKFFRSWLLKNLRGKIKDASIGRIPVHGNFSILCGDPYALCQSIFGMEVTGLLKAGEIYSRFWADRGVEQVAMFRAPMSCANNILRKHIAGTEQAASWYEHITTCTILNAWDTSMIALNGADFDGDLAFTTDNEVLVRGVRELPAIMCVQRKAAKKVPTEADLAACNKKGFGDDIGKITNRITEMFDVQTRFPVWSREYEVLSYRIRCGQLLQQAAIDKIKGIISKPMPKHWYNKRACENDFDRSIVADKKPLFMTHIYPSLSTNNNDVYNKMKCNLWINHRVDIGELLAADMSDLDAEQIKLAEKVRDILPVSTGDCVTNRIFRMVTDSFSAKNKLGPTKDAPETINVPQCRNTALLAKIGEIHRGYEARRKSASQAVWEYRIERKEDAARVFDGVTATIRRECQALCSSRDSLCEALLHYAKGSASKSAFVWQAAGKDLVEYLLERNGYKWVRPVLDEDGDHVFNGKRFRLEEMREDSHEEEYYSVE